MRRKKGQRIIILIIAFCILLQGVKLQEQTWKMQSNEQQTTVETGPYAGVSTRLRLSDAQIATMEVNQRLLVAAALEAADAQKEENVYSFLQGPKSWGEGRTWSGEWCLKYVKGNYFGGFGCGLVCMANIYSTLTDYTCSPWDMYEYATQVSGYYPSKKSGAIGWGDMKVTLQQCGFVADVYQKPATYEEFQQQIADSQSAIVLVSSYEDDTFWTDTSGHYVNIWLYNEETDEVFLTEPGSPEKNRVWIPLRYIYDALKTVSQYQYLLVNDYEEEKNNWLHDGIDDAWVAP